ncbi:MAG: dienelactone hydrolase family protein [Myxococcota bacterium]|nr:dienelactone hydrolase family protein [Myxococcota bacterium]
MPTDDHELGYLAHPDDGPNPGVVMIHDVWGLADHTRDLARRLAQEGFSVLAIDLYRREQEVAIEDPGAWIRGLSDPQVLADVQAGAELLAAHPSTGGRDVGVTGFCMGGMYAVLAACGCPGIAASVAFYGMLSYEHGMLHEPSGLDPEKKPRSPLQAAPELACPLLGLFGEDDAFVPLADVEALRDLLEKAEPSSEIQVYPGAGHAFMNDTRSDAYRPETAEQAWTRMVDFFRDHLR